MRLAGLALLVLCAAACSGDATNPTPALMPEAVPQVAPAQRGVVALDEPEAPREAVPEPAPAAATPLAKPTITIDLGELGKYELITWEEALRRGAEQIDEKNADSEQQRAAGELLGSRP
jgi:hypothetical protein